MKVPPVSWPIAVVAILVCGVISVTVARSVTEKRMDFLLKQHQLSMEREARIWLELMQAVESGETASLSWLYGRGGLALIVYQKQAERQAWAQNPALQASISNYREFRKKNPGYIGSALKRLGSGPWLPQAERSSEL